MNSVEKSIGSGMMVLQGSSAIIESSSSPMCAIGEWCIANSAMSEEWVGNKERFAVDALLRATHRRGRLRACYEMPGTVHQSASDTPLWLPGRLAERLRMKGHGEDGGRTHRAAAEAIHEQVVAAASREAGAAASPQSSLRFGGVAARYPDQLREFTGWVLQR